MSFFKNREINKRRDAMLLSVTAIFLSLYFAFSVVLFSAEASSVRNSVVRLHILANSNTEIDQNVKLKVRNALLQNNLNGHKGFNNSQEAAKYYSKNTTELKNIAEKVLKDNGMDYSVNVLVGKEFYKTRTYGDLTFPAGEYTSLRIILGEGKGENWWCVMFPPLCIPVADDVDCNETECEKYLTKSGNELVSGDYVVKFKILEIFEELKNKTK